MTQVRYTPSTRSQVSDHDTADHEFTIPGSGYARECDIFATAAGLSLTLRLLDDDADLTFSPPMGYMYFPRAVSHIRQATPTTITVIGYGG